MVIQNKLLEIKKGDIVIVKYDGLYHYTTSEERRRVLDGDYSLVDKTTRKFFRLHKKNHPLPDEYREDELRRLIMKPYFVVLNKEGNVIGGAWFDQRWDRKTRNRYGIPDSVVEETHVFVKRNYRGNGIGKRLLETVESERVGPEVLVFRWDAKRNQGEDRFFERRGYNVNFVNELYPHYVAWKRVR